MQAAHDPALPPALQSLLATYPLHSVTLPGGASQIGLRQASPVATAAAAVAFVPLHAISRGREKPKGETDGLICSLAICD